VKPDRRLVVIALLVAVTAVALSALSVHVRKTHHELRAAVIDQLAVTDPNPQLIQAVTDELRQHGYTVDYYPPESVTVDLYRDLPSRRYDLVILRSHAASYHDRGVGGPLRLANLVSLFTNEPYDPSRHVTEQRKNRLFKAGYPDDPSQTRYFSVHPYFIEFDSAGRFPPGAVVVLLGCAGLSNDGMARAFIDRGASAFVSWDANVSAQHTDEAILPFLRHLLGGKESAQEAAKDTLDEIGPDPHFGARLVAYP